MIFLCGMGQYFLVSVSELALLGGFSILWFLWPSLDPRQVC